MELMGKIGLLMVGVGMLTTTLGIVLMVFAIMFEELW